MISHTKDNYLSAQYHRLAKRIGKSKAIVAVSHSLLVIMYHLLRTQEPYSDLGPLYFETRNHERERQRAVRHLQSLGYEVTLHEREELTS